MNTTIFRVYQEHFFLDVIFYATFAYHWLTAWLIRLMISQAPRDQKIVNLILNS